MRMLLIVCMILVGCNIETSDSDSIENSANDIKFIDNNKKVDMEKELGKLIVFHDELLRFKFGSNSFGSLKAIDMFKEVYLNKIKTLGCKEQIDFIWAGMWHLSLNGGEINSFQDFLLNVSCKEEMIIRLSHFVSWSEKVKRKSSKYSFALSTLNLLSHQNQPVNNDQ